MDFKVCFHHLLFELLYLSSDCHYFRLWSRTGLVQEGIIGDASLWTRQILLNRQTPALHTAFATILGTENLLVNQDRYGMFRPAKEHHERATMTNLHLDMNPWNYIEGLFEFFAA